MLQKKLLVLLCSLVSMCYVSATESTQDHSSAYAWVEDRLAKLSLRQKIGQVMMLAAASKAFIVGFNVRPNANAKEMAAKIGVEMRFYSIIYNLLDDVKAVMTDALSPIEREVILDPAINRRTDFTFKHKGLKYALEIDGEHGPAEVLHHPLLKGDRFISLPEILQPFCRVVGQYSRRDRNTQPEDGVCRLERIIEVLSIIENSAHPGSG